MFEVVFLEGQYLQMMTKFRAGHGSGWLTWSGGKTIGRRALKELGSQGAGQANIRVDGGPSWTIMGSLRWGKSVSLDPKPVIRDVVGTGSPVTTVVR